MTDLKTKIAEILKDEIHFSPQIDGYVIHGALEKIENLMGEYVKPALEALRDLRHGLFKDEAAVNQLIDETIANYLEK